MRPAVSLERYGRIRGRRAKGAKKGGVNAKCNKKVRSRTRLSRDTNIPAKSARRVDRKLGRALLITAEHTLSPSRSGRFKSPKMAVI